MITAREREWKAIADVLRALKREAFRELTAVEFMKSRGEFERGVTVAVNAGNVNSLLRLIEPSALQRRGGIDTTVLLRIDDTARQKEMLEEMDWPKERIPRFDIGRMPDESPEATL